MGTLMTDDFDTAVHYQLVNGLLSAGKIPSNSALAEHMAVSVATIENALRRLAGSHGLVLHPHVCEPWIIHPFSVSPSAPCESMQHSRGADLGGEQRPVT